MTHYGFIGTGSMGSMLVQKFIESGKILSSDITVSSKTGRSVLALAEKTGVHFAVSNRDVTKDADLLFLCIKPLKVFQVIEEIHDLMDRDILLILIAGSVTILTLFNAIGTAVETDENNCELYSDLTSCAPAFMAAMMKEFASTAVRTDSIDPGIAEFLVKETMIGTVKILTEGNMSFDDVIDRVATKGGITEEGVKVLYAELPEVFDELLRVTKAKHQLVKDKVCGG